MQVSGWFARVLSSQFASSANRGSRVVGRHPAPGAGSVTTAKHALLINLRDDVAVTGQQRFGRAHFGAQGQLALREPVGAIFLELLDAAARFCAAAARAESAFVHFAPGTEVSK